MLGLLLARQHGEARQLGQRDIHAERPRSGLVAIHPPREFRRHVAALDQLAIEQRRPDIGRYHRRGNLLAALQPHTDRPLTIDQHLGDRSLKTDFHARLDAGLGHILRDRAHPADAMAPHALLAVDLAEHMVEQDIGAARRVR